MIKPIVMHFGHERATKEGYINEELQRDDEKIVSYESYDTCEVM